jgi:NAD+ diphosphatase
MIGFAAIGDPDAPVWPADGEIEQARWFTRDEVLTAMATEDNPADDPDDTAATFVLPGQTSIARQMLAGWATVG